HEVPRGQPGRREYREDHGHREAGEQRENEEGPPFLPRGEGVEDREEDDRHSDDPNPDIGGLWEAEDREEDVRDRQEPEALDEEIDRVDKDASGRAAHRVSLIGGGR